MFREKDYCTIKEASDWATQHLNKNVSPANISYLVQYGRIKKHVIDGGVLVSKRELERYYESFNRRRELLWRENPRKTLSSELVSVNNFAVH